MNIAAAVLKGWAGKQVSEWTLTGFIRPPALQPARPQQTAQEFERAWESLYRATNGKGH